MIINNTHIYYKAWYILSFYIFFSRKEKLHALRLYYLILSVFFGVKTYFPPRISSNDRADISTFIRHVVMKKGVNNKKTVIDDVYLLNESSYKPNKIWFISTISLSIRIFKRQEASATPKKYKTSKRLRIRPKLIKSWSLLLFSLITLFNHERTVSVIILCM